MKLTNLQFVEIPTFKMWLVIYQREDGHSSRTTFNNYKEAMAEVIWILANVEGVV